MLSSRGENVKVNQLDYSSVDPRATSNSTVLMVDNPRPPTENLGVGMYSSLMGTFDLPPPIARIDTISSSKEPLRKEFVQTHYFSDPGPLSSSVTTSDDGRVGEIESSMSAAELRCESIDNSSNNNSTRFSGEALDGDVAHSWTLDSTSTLDCLDIVFPFDKAIFEAMMAIDRPLEELHHHSYTRPPLHEVESRSPNVSTSDVCTVPLAPTQFSAEGNILIGSMIVPLNIHRSKLAEPSDRLYLKKYFA